MFILKTRFAQKNYDKASKLDCELAHLATFLLHKAQVHSWHKKMLRVYKEAQLHARFSYDIWCKCSAKRDGIWFKIKKHLGGLKQSLESIKMNQLSIIERIPFEGPKHDTTWRKKESDTKQISKMKWEANSWIRPQSEGWPRATRKHKIEPTLARKKVNFLSTKGT